jgi:hypothetical protein
MFKRIRESGNADATTHNFSLNWPAGRVRHFELATSAAASYFSR